MLLLSNYFQETRGPTPFTVTQFQLLWPKTGCPSRPSVLLEVMENVNRVQMTTGNKAITIMCKLVDSIQKACSRVYIELLATP